MQSVSNHILFEEIHNFRDMGGYTSNDGRTVKNGLLFRSGELGNMTSVDKTQFQQFQIQTIFDYRDEREALNNVTPIFEGIQNIRIPAKNLPDEITIAAIKELVKSDAYTKIDVQKFTSFYESLPINNRSYQKLVEILVDAKGPMLHHCTAGKDRTGIGSTIIFLILDLPIETIMEDYLNTNIILKAYPPKWLERMREYIDEEVLDVLASCKESYLHAAYNNILTNYGTVDIYLLKEFGIHKELREKVKSTYLV